MISSRTSTFTDFIETLQAEQGDLKVALWRALVILKEMSSNIPINVIEDAIEAKAKEISYKDLKIELHERKKEANNTVRRFFGELFGQSPETP